jgi:thiamine kinase
MRHRIRQRQPAESPGLQGGQPAAEAPPVLLVEDLVARGIVSSAAQWQPLRGGRTNSLWLVTGASGPVVVKRYALEAATPLFPNDPNSEAQVLQVLAATGMVPQILCHGMSQAGPVLVYSHHDGAPWRCDPATAARPLKMLHNLTVPHDLHGLRHAPDGSKALKDQTFAILDQMPVQTAALVRGLEPDLNIPPNGENRILHGDPVPDNIICADHGAGGNAVLIDWQCPAQGDPVLDLALFLSPTMQIITRGTPLSDLERHQFLTAYDDTRVSSRLSAMQPVFHWRMAAYCLWKMTRPVPDQSYAAGFEAEMNALKQFAL